MFATGIPRLLTVNVYHSQFSVVYFSCRINHSVPFGIAMASAIPRNAIA